MEFVYFHLILNSIFFEFFKNSVFSKKKTVKTVRKKWKNSLKKIFWKSIFKFYKFFHSCEFEEFRRFPIFCKKYFLLFPERWESMKCAISIWCSTGMPNSKIHIHKEQFVPRTTRKSWKNTLWKALNCCHPVRNSNITPISRQFRLESFRRRFMRHWVVWSWDKSPDWHLIIRRDFWCSIELEGYGIRG